MTRRFLLDASYERHGATVLAGSPLRLFRVTDAGVEVLRRLERDGSAADSKLIDSLVDAGALHPQPGDGPATFGAAEVTIVTPALGTPGLRPRSAGSASVLVDDGSDPPIADADLRLASNRGPAAARNAGLATVRTPLVAFVDADVELPDGWLERLLPHFDDPRVGLVAPRVRSRAGSTALDRYETEESPLDLGDRPGRVRAGTRVGYVPSAAIVCRVDAIRGVGGFDEQLRVGEDVDLCWRLDEHRWRCRYEPASTVTHAPRATWSGWVRQRIDYGSSAAPLAARHPDALAPAAMNGWSLAAWSLAIVNRPLAGLAVGVGSSAALVRKLHDLPAERAFRLAAVGTLKAGEQLATATRRAWWPVVAVAALRSRTARRVLVVSLLAARHPVRAADDLAYGAGVWRGVWRQRSIRALLPKFNR